jgi:hypothetical protein
MPERTEEQILEEESSSHLRLALSRYVVNSQDNDFGIDFDVALTEEGEERQEVEADHFFVQLKSSQSFEKEDEVHWDLGTDHISQYVNQPVPVVLALYSRETERIYWEIVQEYVWDTIEHTTPDWARQGACRINISRDKTLENLGEFERALDRVQSRITRQKSQNLGIGEGLAFTPDDFTDLETQIETSRDNYKGHLLLKSRTLLKRGREEEAKEALQQVSESTEDDEGKLRSLLIQINMQSIASEDEAMEMAELSQEAIELAQDLGFTGEEQVARVFRNVAALSLMLERRSNWQMSEELQETLGTTDDMFNAIRARDSVELAGLEAGAASAINDALSQLLAEDKYYEYTICLTSILQYVDRQLFIQYLTEEPEEIDTDVHPLIDQAKQLADFVPDLETEFNLRKYVGVYHYNHLDSDLAEEYLSDAKELATEFDDTFLEQDTEELIERVREEPNPYTVEHDNDTNNESLREAAQKILEFQGIDLDEEDDIVAEAARTGIADADPSEYFRFCEHLHLAYRPSILGRSTALQSIGEKILWCRYGGSMTGSSLDNVFESFKSTYCDGCEEHCPRSDDWEYTEDYYEEQFQDDGFQEFLENTEASP